MDWDGSIAALSRAIADPSLPLHLKPVAHLDRGVAFFSKDQYEGAITDFSAAIVLKPDYLQAYIDRGIAADLAGRPDRAIADFADAIRLRPYFARSYYRQMSVYEELGRYSDEINDCNALLRMWPADPEAFVARSDAYVGLGQYDLALADLNGAIGLDGKNYDALLLRGRLHELKGELDAALDDIDRAKDAGLDKSLAESNAGFVQWEMGHFDRAEKSFGRALDDDSGSSFARLGLAVSLMKSRSWSTDKLSKDLAGADLTGWPGPIFALYLGKASVDDLLASAAKGKPFELRVHLCQAQFYLGEWQLARGDALAARASLGETAKSCPPNQIELATARAEIGRIPVPESRP